MRRPMQMALAALAALLLVTSVVLFQQNRKTTADLTEVKAAEQSARSNYAEAFNAIAEIQDSLNAISISTGNVKLQAQTSEAGVRLTEPTRREALESIAQLGASIQRTKEKIGELEERLKKTGNKVAALQKMVAVLKENVAGKEQQISQLSTQVESLQGQVTTLQTTVADNQTQLQAKDQALEDRRRELATVSYVIGNKKTLSEQGLIVAKGGVLGLGKTVELSGNYNENLFTNIDTDQETVIPTTADKIEKVKVLSPQPPTSYQLTMDGNQVAIHIVDAKEFRKVKHLVVITT